MKRNHIVLILLVVIVIFVFVDPVYAGPGGAIAKGLFKTWYGKLLLLILGIILLPVIIYVRTREYFAVRKNKKQLAQLATINRTFNWLDLEKNTRNIIQRVYEAWSKEDMERVSEYVSPWYWRNQQLVFLDQWKENNQQNICKLARIENIKPLYLEISSEENLEGSKIAFSITVEVEDYLVDRTTQQVVEGRKGFGSEEKVWILEYTEGNWLLDDIREGSLSLAFAKLPNVIPAQLQTKTV